MVNLYNMGGLYDEQSLQYVRSLWWTVLTIWEVFMMNSPYNMGGLYGKGHYNMRGLYGEQALQYGSPLRLSRINNSRKLGLITYTIHCSTNAVSGPVKFQTTQFIILTLHLPISIIYYNIIVNKNNIEQIVLFSSSKTKKHHQICTFFYDIL